jgi:hypothetical protein
MTTATTRRRRRARRTGILFAFAVDAGGDPGGSVFARTGAATFTALVT